MSTKSNAPHLAPSVEAPRARTSPPRSPVNHATPRNQALKLGGTSGFARWRGPEMADGPDSIEYDAQAGCPTAVAGGTYRGNVDAAKAAPAVSSGFTLKPDR